MIKKNQKIKTKRSKTTRSKTKSSKPKDQRSKEKALPPAELFLVLFLGFWACISDLSCFSLLFCASKFCFNLLFFCFKLYSSFLASIA
jgi:hypothetical protein